MSSSATNEISTKSNFNSTKEVRSKSSSQKKVGMFNIGDKLGEGTFSKVCLGTHTITNQKVAIKILEKIKIQDASDRQRIEKEINIHKKLMHSNIIQQYCVVETKNTIYIVTEYCSGGELFEYIISKKKILESESCILFRQLIAGVEYLHKMGVVHRDLKPENLLFDDKRNLKIADFGLSNTYTGRSLISTPCGSPCYAAPEMVQGLKYLGAPVDIWSCGIILFTMVCGYLPFEDENRENLFKKISLGYFEIPNYISHFCKDLLKKILNVDPKTRISFEEIKIHPWFKGINNESVEKLFFNSPGLLINEYLIPIDYDIVVEIVEKYKFSLFDVVSDILKNKHTNITITYYLILKDKIQRGEKSVADFSHQSIEFKKYLETDDSKLSYFENNIEKAIDNKCRILIEKLNKKADAELCLLDIKIENQVLRVKTGELHDPKIQEKNCSKDCIKIENQIGKEFRREENKNTSAEISNEKEKDSNPKVDVNKFLTSKSINEEKEPSINHNNTQEFNSLSEQSNDKMLINLTANYFSKKLNTQNKKHWGNYREYKKGVIKTNGDKITEYAFFNTEAAHNVETNRKNNQKDYYTMTEPIKSSLNIESNYATNTENKDLNSIIHDQGKIITPFTYQLNSLQNNISNPSSNSNHKEDKSNSSEKRNKEISEQSGNKNSTYDSLLITNLSFKETGENLSDKLRSNISSEIQNLTKQVIPPSLDLKKRIFKNFFESSMKSKLTEQYDKYVRKSYRFRKSSINNSYESNLNDQNSKSPSLIEKKQILVKKIQESNKHHQSFTLSKNIDYSKEQNPIRKKKFLNTSTVSANNEKSGYDSNTFSFKENSVQPKGRSNETNMIKKNCTVSQSPPRTNLKLDREQYSTNKRQSAEMIPTIMNSLSNETKNQKTSAYNSNRIEQKFKQKRDLKINTEHSPMMKKIKPQEKFVKNLDMTIEKNKNMPTLHENKFIKHRRNHSMAVNENKSEYNQYITTKDGKISNKNKKSISPDFTKDKLPEKSNSKPVENVLSICNKKTPEEIIHIIETILGRNTVQRTGNKIYSHQLKCIYYYGIGANKYSKKMTFLLDVNELKEIKDYIIIKANLIDGPESTFSAICRRIKNKFNY